MPTNQTTSFPAIYYPMLAPEGEGSKLTQLSVWDRFDRLTTEVQNILTAPMMPQKILELQKKFEIDDQNISVISQLVRQLFFGEIDLSGCETKLQNLFPKRDDLSKIQAIVEFIQKEILTLTPPKQEIRPGQNSNVTIVKMTLLKALAEYPRLNDQPITGEKIRVKNQPEAVRPSLGNWIRYYRDELGIGFHDQVTRGKFLFQSENGKRLNNEERERINLVLKSLEEEFPLDIDTERSMIVFPVRTQPSPVSSTFPVHREMAVPARPTKPFQAASVPPAAPSVAPASIPTSVQVPKSSFFGNTFGPAKNVAGDTLHFSTGHVLPGERETQAALAATPSIPTTLQPSVAPAQPPTPAFNVASINRNRGSTLPRSPYSIRPLRLREDANDGEGNQ